MWGRTREARFCDHKKVYLPRNAFAASWAAPIQARIEDRWDQRTRVPVHQNIRRVSARAQLRYGCPTKPVAVW